MSLGKIARTTEEARKLRAELEQIDSLLRSIREQWDDIPTLEDVSNYADDCCIAPMLPAAAKAWGELPSVDDLIDDGPAMVDCTPSADLPLPDNAASRRA